MDTSSQVGEDVMSSDELGVVIGDFLSSTVILGLRDGIVPLEYHVTRFS